MAEVAPRWRGRGLDATPTTLACDCPVDREHRAVYDCAAKELRCEPCGLTVGRAGARALLDTRREWEVYAKLFAEHDHRTAAARVRAEVLEEEYVLGMLALDLEIT